MSSFQINDIVARVVADATGYATTLVNRPDHGWFVRVIDHEVQGPASLLRVHEAGEYIKLCLKGGES